nr:uncharacterized protein LOC110144698 isoform X2 [Odocoileus virginianus texanus]
MGNLDCCPGGYFAQKARRNIHQGSRTSTSSWVKRVHFWSQNKIHPITEPVEVPQEDLVEERPQGWNEEQELSTLKVHGTAKEIASYTNIYIPLLRYIQNDEDFTEDLPVNPACDRTEGTGCFSKDASPRRPEETLLSGSRASTSSWVSRVRCWTRNKVHLKTDPLAEPPEDQLEEVSNSKLEEEAMTTAVACKATYEHASHENPGVKRHQAWAKGQPLSTRKACGAVHEHDFTEDLPVNPACDRTEGTGCFSKVAIPECESDCFLESINSSDEEENLGREQLSGGI